MATFYANATNNFGATNYLVGTIANGAPYQTIQDAIDAAVTTLPAVMVIQPGTYTESISWPAGLSVSSSSSALTTLQVSIVGNQTFTATGELSFESILFTALAGDTWTCGDAGAGTASLDLQNCVLISNAGLCILSASAAGTSNVTTRSTTCLSLAADCADVANGTLRMGLSEFISTAAAGSGLTVGLSALCTATVCQFSGGATGSGVLITGAASQFSGTLNSISGQQGIRFTAAGQATSIRDSFATTDPFFINTSGAFGTLSIGLPLFVSGSTSVDPAITTTIIPTFPSTAAPFPWRNIIANQTLAVNNGYFVNAGALSLLLPAVSAVGDVIEVSLPTGGTSWSITQGAGQEIRAGIVTTTAGAGGSLSSTALGDSVRLVCQTANLVWEAQSSFGSLTAV